MFKKIKNVFPLEDYKLLVQFCIGVTKIYDVKPLFKWKDAFKTLKENNLFPKFMWMQADAVLSGMTT